MTHLEAAIPREMAQLSSNVGRLAHSLGSRTQPRPALDAFFQPRTIAVIGASENPRKVGRSLLWNLLHSPFRGVVYPVNTKRSSVLGVIAQRRIGDVPEHVDLAVIATPAETVPAVIGECAEAGVRGAIIVSAGFREAGERGARLEQEILANAAGKLRIIGPNCVGVMSPLTGLNATFANNMARPGNVGFLSQSGALCTAILDWSLQEGVGFSAFASMGSMLDVGWADMIQYLNDDPQTHSILIYMESVGEARRFLSAAREASFNKPVIVLKAGRSAAGARAAASHTGALTGSDEVLDAAFRRCGVLRVDTIAELFYMSEVLAKQPRPRGPRLAIVTNAGGPGVLAADALLSAGGELAQMSSEAMDTLNRLLPAHWSHNNPIDVIGDADAEMYAKTVETVANDPGNDGLLLILTPQGMTDPTSVAERLRPYAHLQNKAVLASWMGGNGVSAAKAILRRAGIPTFPYPDTAARIFERMWQYSDNLRVLYETPSLVDSGACGDLQKAAPAEQRARAGEIVEGARARGRTLLSEAESKELLAAYGIPVVRTEIAATEDEAAQWAAKIGYPVALKLHSETITHKSDVGGVRLNLSSEEEVRAAFRAIQDSVAQKAARSDFLGVTVQPMVQPGGYEAILGSTIDAQFGPVLLFGAGGQLVEVFRDYALGLPPLNTTLARRMLERTKICRALKGVRGRQPADMAGLERLLVRFSRLVAEQPRIAEIDINPLLISPEGIVALDARAVLHGPDVREECLPRLAIRPYPAQYVQPWRFPSGEEVVIRPIAPEDEPLMAAFHSQLSECSVYFRYFHMLSLEQRIAHERLTRICFPDYDRVMVLVAEGRIAGKDSREILGVARLAKQPGTNEAEFAVLVADRVQRRGLGRELLRRMLDIARDEKLQAVYGQILAENTAMAAVCRRLGFRVSRMDSETLCARFELGSGAPKVEHAEMPFTST
jgi:acetyltransferase